MLRSNLSRAVRHLRRRRGWRQRDLADRAGTSRHVVSRVERGLIRRVSLGRIDALAEALGASVDLTIRWQGGAPRPPHGQGPRCDTGAGDGFAAITGMARRGGGQLQPLRRPRASRRARISPSYRLRARRRGEVGGRRRPGDAGQDRRQGSAGKEPRCFRRLDRHAGGGASVDLHGIAHGATSDRGASRPFRPVQQAGPCGADLAATPEAATSEWIAVVRRGARCSWCAPCAPSIGPELTNRRFVHPLVRN